MSMWYFGDEERNDVEKRNEIDEMEEFEVRGRFASKSEKEEKEEKPVSNFSTNIFPTSFHNFKQTSIAKTFEATPSGLWSAMVHMIRVEPEQFLVRKIQKFSIYSDDSESKEFLRTIHFLDSSTCIQRISLHEKLRKIVVIIVDDPHFLSGKLIFRIIPQVWNCILECEVVNWVAKQTSNDNVFFSCIYEDLNNLQKRLRN